MFWNRDKKDLKSRWWQSVSDRCGCFVSLFCIFLTWTNLFVCCVTTSSTAADKLFCLSRKSLKLNLKKYITNENICPYISLCQYMPHYPLSQLVYSHWGPFFHTLISLWITCYPTFYVCSTQTKWMTFFTWTSSFVCDKWTVFVAFYRHACYILYFVCVSVNRTSGHADF